MKNEFAIKCETWEDACELLVLASMHNWFLKRKCHSVFTKNEFDAYDGIMYFWIEDLKGNFWFAYTTPDPIPYSKQKAIELLSGKEELKISNVTIREVRPHDYEFTFSDGEILYAYRWPEKFVTKARPPQDERVNHTEHRKLIDKWFEENKSNQVGKESCEVPKEKSFDDRLNEWAELFFKMVKPQESDTFMGTHPIIEEDNRRQSACRPKEPQTLQKKLKKAKRKQAKIERQYKELAQHLETELGIETAMWKHTRIMEEITNYANKPQS